MPQEDKDGTWYACPCCDKEFAYSQRRYQHIVEDHLRTTEHHYMGYVLCWCGKWFPPTSVEALQQHWHQHGGMLAHYLASLLGID